MAEVFIHTVELPSLECRCGTPLGDYQDALYMYESDLAAGYRITPAEFAEKIELYKLRADYAKEYSNFPDKLVDPVEFERYAAKNFLPYKRQLAILKRKAEKALSLQHDRFLNMETMINSLYQISSDVIDTSMLSFGDFYLSHLKTRNLYTRELSNCCIGTLLNPQRIAPNTYLHSVRRKELELEMNMTNNNRIERVTNYANTVDELAVLQKRSIDVSYSDMYAIDSNILFSVNVRNLEKGSLVWTLYPRLDGKAYKSGFVM
jgi:hypothetical protein